ncbi:MAG: heat shock protein HspQ [bacterium]
MSSKNDISHTNFSVGEVIHHRLFDYNGVIVDVDPVFSGTEEWYEQVARSRPRKDRPWYHVLVNDAAHTTYVAEQNLESAINPAPVNHPLVAEFFSRFDNGHYLPRQRTN